MADHLIPVFVFPSSLTFYAASRGSHRHVLTLCNPYEFPVGFQVLCSSHEKNKYSVVDPEGRINSRCFVDIVIRHNAVTSQNIGQADKFRIQIFPTTSNKVIGRKDITAELLPGKEPDESSSPQRENFSQVPRVGCLPPMPNYTRLQGAPDGLRPAAPSALVILATMLCGLVLLLPTQGDSSLFLPDYLKPTFHLKLAVSYMLGMVTMILFRPSTWNG